MLYVLNWHFQANPKFNQIRPSRAKASQRKLREKAWISFDSLGRIEPFQCVALTPQGKNSFPQLALGQESTPSFSDCASLPQLLIFAKEWVADA
jgi:hypothetical protein